MENRNYKVRRDSVYVGDVCGINPREIIIVPMEVYKKYYIDDYYKNLDINADKENWYLKDNQQFRLEKTQNYLDYTEGSYYHDFTRFHRSMLFTLDENKHADDLLYNSPHYPILNISNNKDCLESDICICHETFQMERFLKDFGYPEELTFDQILEIRKRFFCVSFIVDNCELLGYKESDPTDTGMEIYDATGKHRTFNEPKYDSRFGWNYFQMIRMNKDYYSPYEENNFHDNFKPCEEEGPINSLRMLF